MRKLGADDRLMQALQLNVAAGQDAYPIMMGIAAGLLCHAQSGGKLRHQMTLRKTCGLSDDGLIRAILDCADEPQCEHRPLSNAPADNGPLRMSMISAPRSA
jgi:hypothetical protein